MKNNRHDVILEIISLNNISTQEELSEELKKRGFDVTQATVSRDIRELNITKISVGNRQRYSVIQNNEKMQDRYAVVLKEGLISIKPAQSLLVVKTVVGMAMAVAAAIDALKIQEIVGSIAGDDTIFIALDKIENSDEVISTIQSFMRNK